MKRHVKHLTQCMVIWKVAQRKRRAFICLAAFQSHQHQGLIVTPLPSLLLAMVHRPYCLYTRIHMSTRQTHQEANVCYASSHIWLFGCSAFKAMRPSARVDLVKPKKLCFNCLLPGYFSRNCRKDSICTVPGCGKKHTKFVIIDDPVEGVQNCTESATQTTSLMIRSGTVGASASACNVYLPIVPVIVNGSCKTYALLDTGSTNSFITESLAAHLHLVGSDVDYVINLLSSSKNVNCKAVSFSLSTGVDDESYRVSNVMVIPNIPARYPECAIDVKKYPHLADLPLCMPSSDTRVNILLGMDNSRLLMPLEVRANERGPGQPYATRMRLGWSLKDNGQLVPKTIRTQDNSYPGQLVPRTTRTRDDSYPRRLVPKTTRTQDDSYLGQLVPKTTRTQENSYQGRVLGSYPKITLTS